MQLFLTTFNDQTIQLYSKRYKKSEIRRIKLDICKHTFTKTDAHKSQHHCIGNNPWKRYVRENAFSFYHIGKFVCNERKRT